MEGPLSTRPTLSSYSLSLNSHLSHVPNFHKLVSLLSVFRHGYVVFVRRTQLPVSVEVILKAGY